MTAICQCFVSEKQPKFMQFTPKSSTNYQWLKYDILGNCRTSRAKEKVHLLGHEISSSEMYAMTFPNVTQLHTKSWNLYLWYKQREMFFSCHSFIQHWGSAPPVTHSTVCSSTGQLADHKVEIRASSHNKISIRLQQISGNKHVSSEVRKFELLPWSFLYASTKCSYRIRNCAKATNSTAYKRKTVVIWETVF